MPAKLKGSATIKVPENAKPGDEITLEDVTFIADQDDFDRSVRDRLKQQQKKHDEEANSLREKISELETKASGPDASAETKKLQEQLTAMAAKQAERDLQDRIQEKLAQKGLADLPKAYRGLIKAKPDASDEELEAQIDEASAEFTSLKTSLSATEQQATPPAKPSFGAQGAGGSRDSQKKIDMLRDKVRTTRPDLERHLTGLSDEMALDVMTTWDAQGHLKPKQ